MIDTLLVANRGEIAARIMRTARRLGIRTVAVFSEPDRNAAHVAAADVAVPLAGSAAADTYLNIAALIDASERTGAQAVHPGYGFLAESAEFAQAVIDAGFKWVGPPPSAIAQMGSKIEARRIMAAAGVPVVPGANLTSDDAAAEAAEVGFPVLVKASAGGGGKGMRVVTSVEELPEAVTSARREAESAFGDGTLFLERFLDRPRHIEVQVIADTAGNVAALFERECSIQRRHQKIVEEAPSTAVDEDLRAALMETAQRAAKAVGYVGAGTVEFLLSQDREFFFLEMNTRLQVEHPVTELITGLDLVELQLLVAEGYPLPAAAIHPTITGHAIEARLYAEDPTNDFLPVAGAIQAFHVDDSVRTDSGIVAGVPTALEYDPMVAKVISWGSNREDATRRLARSLRMARIHGPPNNRALLVRILEEDEFRGGATDTGFLERHDPADLGRPLVEPEEYAIHAAAAALGLQHQRRQAAPVLSSMPSGWRLNRLDRQTIELLGAHGNAVVEYRVDNPVIAVNGVELDLTLVDIGDDSVTLNQAGVHLRYRVTRYGEEVFVDGPDGPSAFIIVPRLPVPVIEAPPGSLHAPMPGRVVLVAVDNGQEVDSGDVVVVIEAMKMEHSIRAPHKGVVTGLMVAAGDQVEAGETLAVVSDPNGDT